MSAAKVARGGGKLKNRTSLLVSLVALRGGREARAIREKHSGVVR
jgi:hypothetical protein